MAATESTPPSTRRPEPLAPARLRIRVYTVDRVTGKRSAPVERLFRAEDLGAVNGMAPDRWPPCQCGRTPACLPRPAGDAQ